MTERNQFVKGLLEAIEVPEQATEFAERSRQKKHTTGRPSANWPVPRSPKLFAKPTSTFLLSLRDKGCEQPVLSGIKKSNHVSSRGCLFDFGFDRRADFFLCRTFGAALAFFFFRPVRVFVEVFLTGLGLRDFRFGDFFFVPWLRLGFPLSTSSQ